MTAPAGDRPRERRFVFGEVAEDYDRARPGYPVALVDDVLAAAGCLAPGGVIALFWNRATRRDDPLAGVIDRVYREHAPDLERQGRGVPEPMDALAASGGFGPVTTREYPWTRTYRADEYARLMSTQSDHRMLPGERRARLLAAVRAAIDDAGGSITVAHVCHLYAATRLP